MEESKLLIVPYGIETMQDLTRMELSKLLIVPYGIETRDPREFVSYVRILLIVPYGIETPY